MIDERDEPKLTVASLANSFLQVFSQRIETYNKAIKLIIEIDRLNQQNPQDPQIFILFEKLTDIFPEGEQIITLLLKQASTQKSKDAENTTFTDDPQEFQENYKENQVSFGIKQEFQDNRGNLALQESNYNNKLSSQDLSNLESQQLTQMLISEQEQEEQIQKEQSLKEDSQQLKQYIQQQQAQITQQQQQIIKLLKQEEQLEEHYEKQKQQSQQSLQTNYQSQPLEKKDIKLEIIEQKQQQKEIKPQQQPSKSISQTILIKPLNHSKKSQQLPQQQPSCQKNGRLAAYQQNFNPIKKIQDAKIIRNKEEDLKYQKHLERIIIFEEKHNIVIPEKFKNIILFFKRSQNEGLPIRCALDESDEQFIRNLCQLLGNNKEVAQLLGLKKQLISTIKSQGNRSQNESFTEKKQTEYNLTIQKNYEQFMQFCQIKSTVKEESKQEEKTKY